MAVVTVIVLPAFEHRSGTRYWVGGDGVWDSTAGAKWSTTAGGPGGASVPTADDDVVIGLGSTVTMVGGITVGSISIQGTLNTGGYSMFGPAEPLELEDPGPMPGEIWIGIE